MIYVSKLHRVIEILFGNVTINIDYLYLILVIL